MDFKACFKRKREWKLQLHCWFMTNGKWGCMYPFQVFREHGTIWHLRAFPSICCCSYMSANFQPDHSRTSRCCVEELCWKTIPLLRMAMLCFEWSVFFMTGCSPCARICVGNLQFVFANCWYVVFLSCPPREWDQQRWLCNTEQIFRGLANRPSLSERTLTQHQVI